jgi:hypothetical protein
VHRDGFVLRLNGDSMHSYSPVFHSLRRVPRRVREVLGYFSALVLEGSCVLFR